VSVPSHVCLHFCFLCSVIWGLKIFFSETAWPKWAEIWWEAPMECSVLSFLKAEWKVSDTGSAQCWASSFSYQYHQKEFTTSCLKSLNTKNKNANRHGLGQTQKCGGVKLVNWTPTELSLCRSPFILLWGNLIQNIP
jgi:hypothetical protein